MRRLAKKKQKVMNIMYKKYTYIPLDITTRELPLLEPATELM